MELPPLPHFAAYSPAENPSAILIKIPAPMGGVLTRKIKLSTGSPKHLTKEAKAYIDLVGLALWGDLWPIPTGSGKTSKAMLEQHGQQRLIN